MTVDERLRAVLWDLSVRYAAAADHGDAEDFADLFTEDATLVVHNGGDRQELRGRRDIRRVPELLGRYEQTFHLLGQGHYQVNDGSGASGEVLCVAHHLRDGTDTVMYIRYEDQYSRDGDESWRIRVRQVRVQWVETHGVSV